MSIVAPLGQVRLFTGIPWDNKYEDTLYFASKSDQTAYFTQLTPVHIMTGATRFHDGVIKVDALEDNIRHCNYMMFQNMNFGSKWFYAFITGTEYVNNQLTYVYYEIDEIQTWLYDGCTLLQCMIDRQHSETDAIFGNLIPEDIGAPELFVETDHILNTSNEEMGFGEQDISCVVFASVDWDDVEQEPVTSPIQVVNNLLTCATPVVEATNYIQDGQVNQGAWAVAEGVLDSIIEANKSDAIIGGVCVPSYFCNYTQHSQGRSVYYELSNFLGSMDGYTPKNKKLLNSPYNVIRLQASDGQSVFLKPELVDSPTYISFRCIPVITMNPEVTVIPLEYKGQSVDYEDAITFNKFPQFAYAVDGYKAWVASGGLATAELQLSQTTRAGELAQNKNAVDATFNTAKQWLGMQSEGLTNLTNTAKNMYQGDVVGTGLSIVKGVNAGNQNKLSIAQTITDAVFTHKQIEQQIQFANENFDLQNAIAKTFAPSIKGQSTGSALVSDFKVGFSVDRLTPKAQQVKAIDDYFTMFGYKQNKIAVPNIHARSRFTYIKTLNCKVSGGAPISDITAIENIFNSGIRFWVSSSDIGNYTDANNVLT